MSTASPPPLDRDCAALLSRITQHLQRARDGARFRVSRADLDAARRLHAAHRIELVSTCSSSGGDWWALLPR